MRKDFLIFVKIVIVFLFLRTEFARHFFGGVAESVVAWYEDIGDMPERSKIIALRDTFMRNNMSLKPHQFDYVIEITDSSEEINKFYQLYCVKKDVNPYIYGDNLAKLCLDIQDSELLARH
jgi:hypothetical protein